PPHKRRPDDQHLGRGNERPPLPGVRRRRCGGHSLDGASASPPSASLTPPPPAGEGDHEVVEGRWGPAPTPCPSASPGGIVRRLFGEVSMIRFAGALCALSLLAGPAAAAAAADDGEAAFRDLYKELVET